MKRVTFDPIVKDPDIKRPCECQCCFSCKEKLLTQKQQYCETFGTHRCSECNEWRCIFCFNETKDRCNYCLRL